MYDSFILIQVIYYSFILISIQLLIIYFISNYTVKPSSVVSVTASHKFGPGSSPQL